MVESDNLRYTKMALNNGFGAIPALGFGTPIPDPVATRAATKAALETGFRLLDASERYRNEKEVGEAMQEVFKAGKIKREDVFIATKLSELQGQHPMALVLSRGGYCPKDRRQHERLVHTRMALA